MKKIYIKIKNKTAIQAESIFFKKTICFLLSFFPVMFNITALIIFPVKYSEQSGKRAGDSWSVGWAYIVGWAVTAMQIFCALLLCLDKDADEVLVREKTEYDNGIEEEVII